MSFYLYVQPFVEENKFEYGLC